MFDKWSATRRSFLKSMGVLTGSAMLSGITKSTFASDEFPSKAITISNGFGTGGGTDRSSRLLAGPWAKALGTNEPFRFEYPKGAGGIIAVKKMMAAPPDGYLLNVTVAVGMAWMFALHKDLKFGIDDVGIVGSYITDPDVLLVKKDSKYDRIDQFIDEARESKVPFTIAVSHPMSSSHAATVVLRELSGANIKPIPFEGGSSSRNAVAGGHVTACIAPYWSAVHVLELTKAIGIFWDHNPAPDLWQPVVANEVLDFEMPHLLEPLIYQCHGEVKAKYPERYNKLVETLEEAISMKETAELAKAHGLSSFLRFTPPEEVRKFIDDYLQMLEKYIPLMKKDLENFM